ncbi:hypothetical protein Tco_0212749 [Tanacetum coccineum]
MLVGTGAVVNYYRQQRLLKSFASKVLRFICQKSWERILDIEHIALPSETDARVNRTITDIWKNMVAGNSKCVGEEDLA